MVEAIQIKREDNVAVAVKALKKGDEIKSFSLTSLSDIPQGHKIALSDIKKGEDIIRYGVALGSAKEDIKRGEYV